MRDFSVDFAKGFASDFGDDFADDFGVSFGLYMNEWLYGRSGYYSRATKGDEKIGKEGDFYTAVSVSRFFGGAIARHIIDLLECGKLELPLGVVEFGAHSGRLLSDIIDFLDILSVGVLEQTRFFSIEPLEILRKMQSQNPHITPLKDLSELKLANEKSIFMLSNELFDAFACEVVRENHFCFVKDFDSIVWRSDEEIERQIQKLQSQIEQSHAQNKKTRFYKNHLQKMLSQKKLDKVQNGEISLGLESFIRSVCDFIKSQDNLKSWRFLSFDYGGEVARDEVTLRGYKAHRVLSFEEISADLRGLFGKCDLTYEVDFSRIITLFGSFGVRLQAKSRLNAALVEFGIDRLLEEFFLFCQNSQNQNPQNKDLQNQISQNQISQSEISQNPKMQIYQQEVLRVRELLSPNGMGERFICVEFGS